MMSDELKRRRPPPIAYDDPVANAAVEIRAGCKEIAEAIEKLVGAIEKHVSKSDAKEEN